MEKIIETVLSDIRSMGFSQDKLIKIYDFIVNNHCDYGFIEYDRHKDYLTNPANFIYNKKKKGKIIGWSRGKGKTEVTIMYLLVLYYLGYNWKIMVNPSETRELKENIIDRIKKFRNWPDDYKIGYNDYVNNESIWVDLIQTEAVNKFKKDVIKKEIVQIDCKKCNILIFLPQISKNILKTLPIFDLRIVDEAQRRILEKGYELTQNRLLNTKLKSQYKILGLSGSPYGFSDEEWDRHLISTLQDMPSKLREWLPNVKLVSTGDFDINKFKDYNSNLYLKDQSVKKVFTNKNIEKIENQLNLIMTDLLNEISQPNNKFISLLNLKKILPNKWVKGLYAVKEKVVIRTPLTSSAELLCDIIKNLDQENKLNVQISHSKNDSNLKIFNEFWKSDKSLILIVVDRGTLGFDNNKWAHSIDFTFGLNIVNIEQFLDRQRPYENKKKLFYKVCSDLTMEHTDRVMTFILHLRLPWFYKNFNGDNYDFLPLLKEYVKKIKSDNHDTNDEKDKNNKKIKLPKLIPIDNDIIIEAFKQLQHKRKGTFEIFAEHTFGDWDNKIKFKVPLITDEEIIKSTEGHKFILSWEKEHPQERLAAIYHKDTKFWETQIVPKFKKFTYLDSIDISKKDFKRVVNKLIKDTKEGEYYPTLFDVSKIFGYEEVYHTFLRFVEIRLDLNDWFKEVTFRKRGQKTKKFGTPKKIKNWFFENDYLGGFNDHKFRKDRSKKLIDIPKWIPSNPRALEIFGYDEMYLKPKWYSHKRKNTANELNKKQINKEFDNMFWGNEWKTGKYNGVANFRKACMDIIIDKYNITNRQLVKILGNKISHQKIENIPTKKISELKKFFKTKKSEGLDTYQTIMRMMMKEFPISRSNIKSILDI